MTQDDAFRSFVEDHSRSLLRAAWLMTGDWSSAEDLVQTSLLTTWTHWALITDTEHPERYARQVLTTTYLQSQRRRWRHELPSDRLPVAAEADAGYEQANLRESLRSALQTLPRRQRAALVLRYFLDYSEAQAAEALGCSAGAVKSYTSKGASRLRAAGVLDSVFDGRSAK